MNYKIENLYNIIYAAFIRGEYSGGPKIPSKNEVLSKIEELTTLNYEPITKNDKMEDIDINKIRESFSNIVDDINILFQSIESESNDILGQLTNSLKEHNGTKRELRLIKTSAEDIAAGKLGEEFLKYNYTESFNDSTNINLKKSDPINFDAGIFTINRDNDNILSMRHYYGSKLDFTISENYSQILDYGFIGNSDAGIIFDQTEEQLSYKITTSSPTSLKVSFVLQLLPDASETNINAVTLDVDSDIAKGYIRLYYKNSYEWKDVPTNSIQEIKNNKIIFNFPPTNCSYIKIEFIKDSPDSFNTNSYFININNITISNGISKRTAVLYSKPITVIPYDKETSIISTISVSGDYDLPNNCVMNVYVTPDIKISGGFLNEYGEVVNYDSPKVYEFDNTYSGSVFLSEIWAADSSISGILAYKGIDFNWQQIKLSDSTGEQTPELISFSNTVKNNKIDNSLFNSDNIVVFGDRTYSGVYTLSGWVNTDNPNWDTLESYVDSEVYVSGIDIATDLGIAWNNIEDSSGNLHPDILSDNRYSGQWIGYSVDAGYPFNYSNGEYYLKFNDYIDSVNGWWREYSEIIHPSGIDSNFSGNNGFLDDKYVSFGPDFYFNNIPFYKIYKFGYTTKLVDQSLRLYTYQERPVSSYNDYYPTTFVWKYKNEWIDQIGSVFNVFDPNYPTGWINYILPVSSATLKINEEYILNAITDLKIHNTNSILDSNEYQVLYDGVNITGIYLAGLESRTGLSTQGITFDYNYKYKVKNEYLSTWTGYAIVLPGTSDPYILIPNTKLLDKNINLIQKIVIEDLSNGETYEAQEDGGVFTITFNNQDIKIESQYKITIFCASDNNTGFCAENWIPFENVNIGTITVSQSIKLVSKIDPIKLVSLDTLIYDTTLYNNNRAALYVENNEKYLVVKAPSKDLIPGYYFDSINKKYNLSVDRMIENKGHWIRKYSKRDTDGLINSYYYTTGSKNNNIIYKKDFITTDNTWNDGATLADFPNYTGIIEYPHHTTFGYPINISPENTQDIILYPNDTDPRAPISSNIVGSDDWLNWISAVENRSYVQSGRLLITDKNRGYLFYPTAENLPSYYSISYRLVNNINDNNRFLYKVELNSDDSGSLVPKLRSIRFIINEDIDA